MGTIPKPQLPAYASATYGVIDNDREFRRGSRNAANLVHSPEARLTPRQRCPRERHSQRGCKRRPLADLL